MDPLTPLTPEQTTERRQRLLAAARPLIRLLATEYQPHHTVIVTNNSVELVEGVVKLVQINDYIQD